MHLVRRLQAVIIHKRGQHFLLAERQLRVQLAVTIGVRQQGRIRVNADVPLQVAFLRKRSIAAGARERSNIEMEHHVLLQIILLGEGPAASRTCVRFFVTMRHHVHGEADFVRKRTLADFTC